jgi:quercetin dioxygenase-like cupin family protein
MTATTTATGAIAATRSDEGEARWWWGNLAILKLTGEHTNGGLTVVEVTMGPGRMAPPHVHHREEETFLVLDGELTFHIGDKEITAGPGDLVVGPRDVPHRFQAGPGGARLLFLLTPAGLEGLIREQSVPASQKTLPPEGSLLPPPDLAAMAEIAQRYGCELLV